MMTKWLFAECHFIVILILASILYKNANWLILYQNGQARM